MMKGKWHEVECISVVQPPAREDDSSKKVVYLRKDFTFHEAEGDPDSGDYKSARWTYLETTLPKDVVDLLTMTDDNTQGIANLEDALCELDMGA